MKSLSDNFLTLVLIFALGLSPLQSVFASVINCMNMSSNMHQQMKSSDKAMSDEMIKSTSKRDCCNKNECGTTHCVSSAMTAVMPSVTSSDITYTTSTLYIKSSVALVQFYPSSLYRPPKI
jgi:hypothetical protein